MQKTDPYIITDKKILSSIHLVRDQKIMLAADLAFLYGVDTKVLNQSVKRHLKRFPADFMFYLTREEFDHLRSQIVTSSWGGARYLPMAFTEQGVAMLSSILNSDRAIEVNIRIIRLFTRMRELLLTQKDILLKLEQLETQTGKQDKDIQLIFRYLKQLLHAPQPPRRKIDFIQEDR
jgi:hypothetical protein